jgi:hypothetical protein
VNNIQLYRRPFIARLLAIHFYVAHTFINSINDLLISFYSERYLSLHVLSTDNGKSSGAARVAFSKEAKSGAAGVSQLQDRSEMPGTGNCQGDPL